MNEKPCCEKCTDGSISGIWCNNTDCPCHTPAPQEEWEKEFAKVWEEVTGKTTGYVPYGFFHPILDFISSLIERVRREDTLSGLIERCGEEFRWLKHKGHGKQEHWMAQQRRHPAELGDVRATGKTPKEAVRNLLSRLDRIDNGTHVVAIAIKINDEGEEVPDLEHTAYPPLDSKE